MLAKILNGQTNKQKTQLSSLHRHCLLFFFGIKSVMDSQEKKLALYIILQQLMLLQPKQHSEVPGILEEKIQVAKV